MSSAPGLRERVLSKKRALDALRPFDPQALASLERWYDVELTYTSNAIEGNTLTRQETAIVLEKGITVRGKPLKDHQEAIDHYDALLFVRSLVKDMRPLTEADVRDLHRLATAGTLRREAGRYSQHARRIAGPQAAFPPPEEIPLLMSDFGRHLSDSPPGPDTAFESHLTLVTIHPFTDGNGRTARLLMNLILMRDGFPPVVIAPEHRPDYLESLEATHSGDKSAYVGFMLARLESALDDYLNFIQPKAT